MASAAERFHIVLSPDEKRGWTARAAAIGIPTAEYVRRAVAAFDEGLNADQLGELSVLAAEVEASVGRMNAMIDDACQQVGRPVDDEAMRARVAARLAAEPVQIDPSILDFSGYHPFDAKAA